MMPRFDDFHKDQMRRVRQRFTCARRRVRSGFLRRAMRCARRDACEALPRICKSDEGAERVAKRECCAAFLLARICALTSGAVARC